MSLLLAPVSLFGAALAVPQRLGRMLTDAEQLLTDARSSLASVDLTIASAEAAVKRVNALLDETETIVARTRGVVTAADGVAADAAVTVRTADTLTGTARDLLGQIQPSVERVLPLAQKFTDSVSPHEVDAAIALVNDLPELTRSLRDDVLPVLGTLNGVGPDVNELLHVMDDVRRAILGIPGFTFLKKRGAERIEEDEATEAHPRDPDMDVHVHDRPDG